MGWIGTAVRRGSAQRRRTSGRPERRFDHGKDGKHGRDAGGRQGRATRRDVGRCRSWPASRFRGQPSSTTARASQSPSKQTNTLEQKVAKIAKKSKTSTDFCRLQYVFQRRPQPPLEALSACFLRDLCDVLFS
jgi:hypothetical protein